MASLTSFFSFLNCKFTSLFNNSNSSNNNNNSNNKMILANEKLLKSLKNRFNYASASCSARILSTNPETLSASSLLSQSKDAYLRNSCATKGKFVVVELCEEVKIDTILLANYELFSSTFKRFQVYGAADNSNWKLLLNAEMCGDPRLIHSEQAFPVPVTSSVFIKFLRIEFDDEYYGFESLCPVSVVKVYGKTMLDEFNEEVRKDQNALNNNLPIYSQEDLILTPEMKDLLEEMTSLSGQITQIHLTNTFFFRDPFLMSCPKEEGSVIDLKERFTELEGKLFNLQTSQSKSHGNVFKNLNDRLNKLESSLKHPLNLILFRSRRTIDTKNHPLDNTENRIPLLEGDKSSFEELFSGLNDEIIDLKGNLKLLKSELSKQQTKISLLLTLNLVLITIFLGKTFKRIFFTTKIKTKKSPSIEFRRLPLLELKSPSSSTLSINSSISSSSRSNVQTSSNPGVVLSDDEVLLLDEDL